MVLETLTAVVVRLATMLPSSSPASTPSKAGPAKRTRDEPQAPDLHDCELTPLGKRPRPADPLGGDREVDTLCARERVPSATGHSQRSTRALAAVLPPGVDGHGGLAGSLGEKPTPHTLRKCLSTCINADFAVRDAATAVGGADGSTRKRLRASGSVCAAAKMTEGGKGKLAVSPKKLAAACEAGMPVAENWTREEQAERREWLKEDLRKDASRKGGKVPHFLVGRVVAWEQATDAFAVKYDDSTEEWMDYECMKRGVLECKSVYRERESLLNQRLEKEFFCHKTGKSFGFFPGTVHEWAGKTDVYVIKFDDGQEEVLSHDETKSLVLSTSQKSKRGPLGKQVKTSPPAPATTCEPAPDCATPSPVAPRQSMAGSAASRAAKGASLSPHPGCTRSWARSVSPQSAKSDRVCAGAGEEPHAPSAAQAGARIRDADAQALSVRAGRRCGGANSRQEDKSEGVSLQQRWNGAAHEDQGGRAPERVGEGGREGAALDLVLDTQREGTLPSRARSKTALSGSPVASDLVRDAQRERARAGGAQTARADSGKRSPLKRSLEAQAPGGGAVNAAALAPAQPAPPPPPPPVLRGSPPSAKASRRRFHSATPPLPPDTAEPDVSLVRATPGAAIALPRRHHQASPARGGAAAAGTIAHSEGGGSGAGGRGASQYPHKSAHIRTNPRKDEAQEGASGASQPTCALEEEIWKCQKRPGIEGKETCRGRGGGGSATASSAAAKCGADGHNFDGKGSTVEGEGGGEGGGAGVEAGGMGEGERQGDGGLQDIPAELLVYENDRQFLAFVHQQFDVLRMIGTGTYGEVYECYDRVNARLVALKRLIPGINNCGLHLVGGKSGHMAEAEILESVLGCANVVNLQPAPPLAPKGHFVYEDQAALVLTYLRYAGNRSLLLLSRSVCRSLLTRVRTSGMTHRNSC